MLDEKGLSEEGTYMKDSGCKTLKLFGSAYNHTTPPPTDHSWRRMTAP